MENLKTVEQMQQYCVDHKITFEKNKKENIKQFTALAKNISEEEKVYCVFVGLHNFQTITRHEKAFAYGITNKRIVMAQRKLFGSLARSIDLEDIKDISMSKSSSQFVSISTLCIMSAKEKIYVGVATEHVEAIFQLVREAWDTARANA